MRLNALAFVVSATLTPQALAVVHCGSPPTDFWADQCNTPSIRISGDTIDSVTLTSGTYGWQIVVTLCGSGDVAVDAPVANQDIESIEIRAATNCTQSATATLLFPLSNRVRDVLEIVQGTGIATLDVLGQIDGDLGNVTATTIDVAYQVGFPIGAGLHVGGDLVGDVVLSAYTEDTDFVQLSRLRILGSVLGNIEALNGAIDAIDVDGDIGDDEEPVNIFSRTDIGGIVAHDINAHIEAGHEFDGLDQLPGNIRHLNAFTDGSAGNFTGSITAKTLGEPLNEEVFVFANSVDRKIDIAGDFGSETAEARIRFTEPVANVLDSFSVPRAIVIGGSLIDSITDPDDPEIQLAADDLEGQIIINNGNGAGVLESGAKVKIGAVVLSTAYYTTLPGAIGGGSVGAAPFYIQSGACDPPSGSEEIAYAPDCSICLPADCESLEATDYTLDSVIIAHFGPVAITTDDMVRVERFVGLFDYLSDDPWTDVSGSFESEVVAGGVDDLLVNRIIVSRRNELGWEPGYTYRLSPIASDPEAEPTPRLYTCLGVAGDLDVANWVYYVYVDFVCDYGLLRYNLNEDNALTSADVVEWYLNPVDVNQDNVIDAQDAYDETVAVSQWPGNPYPPQ